MIADRATSPLDARVPQEVTGVPPETLAAAAAELHALLDANPDLAGPLHDALRHGTIKGNAFIGSCGRCIYGTLGVLRGFPVEWWNREERDALVARYRALRAVSLDVAYSALERVVYPIGEDGPYAQERAEWLDAQISDWKKRAAK